MWSWRRFNSNENKQADRDSLIYVYDFAYVFVVADIKNWSAEDVEQWCHQRGFDTQLNQLLVEELGATGQLLVGSRVVEEISVAANREVGH